MHVLLYMGKRGGRNNILGISLWLIAAQRSKRRERERRPS
jgi:hypothetical protein